MRLTDRGEFALSNRWGDEDTLAPDEADKIIEVKVRKWLLRGVPGGMGWESRLEFVSRGTGHYVYTVDRDKPAEQRRRDRAVLKMARSHPNYVLKKDIRTHFIYSFNAYVVLAALLGWMYYDDSRDWWVCLLGLGVLTILAISDLRDFRRLRSRIPKHQRADNQS